ncbi:MAG: hypothetical protein EOO46_24875 [Flavobacterium sp.]|nr:MAG: hypothetical protein EOO46_24875 [Flavobacterium sp.]
MFLLLLACTNQAKRTEKIASKDKVENSRQTKDTTIFTANADTVKISKGEFNEMRDNYSSSNKDYPIDPDLFFYGSKNVKDFESECGQDTFYTLYAHFLQKKNGIDKYSIQRKTLIEICDSINALFGRFQYGGTYFGHQYSRIPGYVEYSIYRYKESENNIKKTYDITKQKQLYIASLRQLIADESSIDKETLGSEKPIRTKELNRIVDQISELITSNFYLRRAQEFQYEHYEYF